MSQERERFIEGIDSIADVQVIKPTDLIAHGVPLDQSTSIASLAAKLGFHERQILSSERKALYDHIENIVGMPGVIEITDLSPEAVDRGNRIFAIRFDQNPTGTKWDNVYYRLLRDYEERKLLTPGVSRVIEGTSGGAGGSLLWAAQQLDYKAVIVIPEDVPVERIQALINEGAKVVPSPPGKYGPGNVDTIARYIAREAQVLGGRIGQNPLRVVPVVKTNREARRSYFEVAEKSSNNIKEITGKIPDIWIAVVGSGATASGIGEYVHQTNPQGVLFAVTDAENPALYYLSQGQVYNKVFTPNILGSISPGLAADHLNINWSVINYRIDVTLVESLASLQILHEEGLMVGETSGAEFAAARKLARAARDQIIVINFNDAALHHG